MTPEQLKKGQELKDRINETGRTIDSLRAEKGKGSDHGVLVHGLSATARNRILDIALADLGQQLDGLHAEFNAL